MSILSGAAAEFLGSLAAALMLALGHGIRHRIEHRARRRRVPTAPAGEPTAAPAVQDGADTPGA
ncbi:hypothetical protein GCM10018980_29310 [Streptomyces capoamus]|uniref:Uncharacterized protein n=1 Tax=Streptomyces capoamus TaxID=68183 RepID=A0A919EVR0_9ACTN|nr:hypothetical protein [Streptomyces capoamus]GGW19094.1 hypothetical protein GCM10010501_52500 [Streptomyces libani subsp. rufus]GHG48782.1 hypothetical protein GCM10018980_29310 [Streptomyces capoamus]